MPLRLTPWFGDYLHFTPVDDFYLGGGRVECGVCVRDSRKTLFTTVLPDEYDSERLRGSMYLVDR